MQRLALGNLIVPDYMGNTVANIPATVAMLLGAESHSLPPLRKELWEPLLADGAIDHVVLLLIDGMGQNLVQRHRADTEWLTAQAIVSDQITSVFPSTTVNALSTLWTGAAPGQHGLVGLELFFPMLGVMGQMLSLSPSFVWQPDALVRAGVDPESFLPVPSIAETLAHGGIDAYSLKHYSLVRSSLSRMFSRGVKEDIGIVTLADLLWHVRTLLQNGARERTFISAYWAAIDSLSHHHGFDHPAVAAELRSVLQLLRTELFEQLTPEVRRRTVFILTADHGQINAPLAKRIFLEDHPELQQMLLMRMAGEPRTAYLYARDGQRQAVIDYVQERLNHAALAIDAREALDAGLFGPPPYMDELAIRVGDVVVTMREAYSLLSRQGDEGLAKLIGRHGGLTPAEMEVPYYAFRFS